MNHEGKDKTSLVYRPEVDGLRAIAVLSVIIYHAEFLLFGGKFLQGGYLGVDIFFVISGYLITKIIVGEIYSTGSFNILNFYDRRARRIGPMLFLVMLASFPFAWFLLLPTALEEFAGSILSSILFVSNFFFYFSTTEYGAESSLLKPFLHTWSLSVEEQFYLIFPLLVLAVHRLFKDKLASVLLAFMLLSLYFSEVMSSRNFDLNFYLPFSRFWELGAGSMLAILELRFPRDTRKRGIADELLPVVGMFLVIVSILQFDSNTFHPGYITLIPIVGVSLVIYFSTTEDLVGKVLGNKYMVYIGLLSYSAYLWHFPLFAYARIFAQKIDNVDKTVLIVATLILAWLSYKFFETPLRLKAKVGNKKFYVALALMLSVVVGMCLLVFKNNGFENRFHSAGILSNYELDNEKLRKTSWNVLKEKMSVEPVFDDVDNKVLIVGNSHAKDIFNALYLNRQLLPGFDFAKGRIEQLSCFDEKLDLGKTDSLEFYSSTLYSESTHLIISTRYKTKRRCHKSNKSEPLSDDFKGLTYLLSRAISDGKKIILMGNTVEFDEFNEKPFIDYYYDTVLSRLPDGDEFAMKTALDNAPFQAFKHLKLHRLKLNEKVLSVAERFSVPYFDKTEYMCDFTVNKCPVLTPEGFKIYFDYGHLTLDGARFVGEKMIHGGLSEILIDGIEDSRNKNE